MKKLVLFSCACAFTLLQLAKQIFDVETNGLEFHGGALEQGKNHLYAPAEAKRAFPQQWEQRPLSRSEWEI